MRILAAFYTHEGQSEPMPWPELPLGGTEPKPPWVSRWRFDRGNKAIEICVRVRWPTERGETKTEIIDARDFIERLTSFPKGCIFQILVRESEAQ
jgi:hypothetical protein